MISGVFWCPTLFYDFPFNRLKTAPVLFCARFFKRNNALDGFLLESLLQHLIKVLIGCPLMYLAASPTMALGGICASHELGHTQLIHEIREQSPHRNQQWLSKPNSKHTSK